jgi:hypothetical protein
MQNMAGYKYDRIITVLFHSNERHNGLRYLRWGGDGEAVQPEKG